MHIGACPTSRMRGCLQLRQLECIREQLARAFARSGVVGPGNDDELVKREAFRLGAKSLSDAVGGTDEGASAHLLDAGEFGIGVCMRGGLLRRDQRWPGTFLEADTPVLASSRQPSRLGIRL